MTSIILLACPLPTAPPENLQLTEVRMYFQNIALLAARGYTMVRNLLKTTPCRQGRPTTQEMNIKLARVTKSNSLSLAIRRKSRWVTKTEGTEALTTNRDAKKIIILAGGLVASAIDENMPRVS